MTSSSLAVLLALALLSNGCAPLTPPPGQGTHLRYAPREGATHGWVGGPDEPSAPESERPQRLHLRQGPRETGPVVDPGGVEDTGSALAAHLAFLGAVDEVSASAHRISREMSTLRASHQGIAGAGNGLFVRHLEYKESVEALTLLSALKFTLPALRAAAPATLGMGFMVGSGGVMMGTRMVVSAEWVEMMRRLVRAGVLSLPAVSAAVRIQAGQVMMAHGELPRGVREALGEGPEVRGMRVTDRAGAGMAEPPGHHVMPQEFREWFNKRGFTGEMDIDRFCVRLEQAHHQAIHGGGNWKLGRTWPGEWNRMIMETLLEAEADAGRMLTRNEILKNVAERMKEYGIPMKFIRRRGR
ncbi:DUF2380 domain-containing protein [Archangium violaceum]|uniref:DUF2380 domain-containing protein n=1 Tax=Archangium violaceum TaxID=83451 RepID=UPI0005BDFC4C|nr:hypothetical protein [Archangium violaceum]